MENDHPAAQLIPIGHVLNEVTEQRDENWGEVCSTIELFEPYAPGLQGLEQFSHAIVLTYLHQAHFDPAQHLVRRPRGLASMPLLGLFAQRVKDRPNPIGITVVQITGVQGSRLQVKGLDAIHGTPILDIKPFFPAYDQPKGPVRIPGWVQELMQNYF